MPTVARYPGALALGLGLVACSPPPADRVLVYESARLRVYVSAGEGFCAGEADELEKQAERLESVVGLERGVVEVNFGGELVDSFCDHRFDVGVAGCYVSKEDKIGATRASFAHEYVHALQKGVDSVHPFWSEGAATYLSIRAFVSEPRGSFPPELRGVDHFSPVALLSLPRGEFRSAPRSYEVASHFFFYLEDRYGLDAVRGFHSDLWGSDDAESVFERAFGDDIATVSAHWTAHAAANYEPHPLAEEKPFCRTHVELPLALTGSQSCEEPDVYATGELGTIGTQDICFTLSKETDVFIEFHETGGNALVHFDRVHSEPCQGSPSLPSAEDRTFDDTVDGIAQPFAGCTWRVRVGAKAAVDTLWYDLRISAP